MQEQQEEGIPDKESLEHAVAVLSASSDIGWACENGIWFYRDENGQLYKGWQLVSGKWYYCINGKMLYDCWYQTGENEYSQFDRSGVWLGSSSTPG